jgi:hypothetical protein
VVYVREASAGRVNRRRRENIERTLRELCQGNNVPQRVKDRAEAVRLNAQGWYVGGLWDQARVGRPPILSAEDMACIKKWLREVELLKDPEVAAELARLREQWYSFSTLASMVTDESLSTGY